MQPYTIEAKPSSTKVEKMIEAGKSAQTLIELETGKVFVELFKPVGMEGGALEIPEGWGFEKLEMSSPVSITIEMGDMIETVRDNEGVSYLRVQ